MPVCSWLIIRPASSSTRSVAPTGRGQQSEEEMGFPRSSVMEIDMSRHVWQHNHGGVEVCLQRLDHPPASLNDVSLPFLLPQSTRTLQFRPPPPAAAQQAASDDRDDDVCIPGHGEDCLARPCCAPQTASHRPAPPRPRPLDAAVSRHRVCFLSFTVNARWSRQPDVRRLGTDAGPHRLMPRPAKCPPPIDTPPRAPLSGCPGVCESGLPKPEISGSRRASWRPRTYARNGHPWSRLGTLVWFLSTVSTSGMPSSSSITSQHRIPGPAKVAFSSSASTGGAPGPGQAKFPV